jgi:hypothetical protein
MSDQGRSRAPATNNETPTAARLAPVTRTAASSAGDDRAWTCICSHLWIVRRCLTCLLADAHVKWPERFAVCSRCVADVLCTVDDDHASLDVASGGRDANPNASKARRARKLGRGRSRQAWA